MSTRCHVELWDAWYENQLMPGVFPTGTKGKLNTRLGVRLYHHSDGYPDFMRPKLKRFLPAVYEYLKEAGYPYWWDSERVGAVMILLSMEDYSEPLKPFSTDRPNDFKLIDGKYPVTCRHQGGVPAFQPCMDI